MADQFVAGAGVRLATRDHGGDGTPLILIHGAGRTLVDFAGMVPVLAAHHRLVAFDLRGHGHSEEGGWDWDAVVADVRAVAAAYGLERPAVAGHSLGGIVAALYGERQDCRAVINIDGHLSHQPDTYYGLEREVVLERIAELKSLGQASLQGTQAPLDASAVAEARSAALAQAQALGLDAGWAAEAFERALEPGPDATWRRRPTMATWQPLNAAVEDLDLFTTYRRLPCPLLIYNAVAPDPAGTPEWLAELMTALRQGLRREMGELAATRSNVRVQEVEANHWLILDHPELVAGQMVDFLESC